ncbi:hypothetical protein D1BOALGB6SA_6248 [Olavius sp. associated proteobacterium Delta 1]|nr:hypothetical protein D1BOALGB6SA_6248 [Olavius sp. associated proteobacterium Delta 1]
MELLRQVSKIIMKNTIYDRMISAIKSEKGNCNLISLAETVFFTIVKIDNNR